MSCLSAWVNNEFISLVILRINFLFLGFCQLLTFSLRLSSAFIGTWQKTRNDQFSLCFIRVESSSPTSNQVSPSNGIAKSQVSPTTNSQKPVVQTFLVTSAAPLASMDEDFPMSVQLRDTTIEERYLEVRRRTKLPPVDGNSLVEYDSCTVLSSADPSMAGYRRTRNDNDFDNDTISSKSAPIDDNDEHAQISQMITASFMQPYSSSERFKRSPSFYDNVNEEDQLVHNYHRQQQQQYTFDTEIRWRLHRSLVWIDKSFPSLSSRFFDVELIVREKYSARHRNETIN